MMLSINKPIPRCSQLKLHMEAQIGSDVLLMISSCEWIFQNVEDACVF